MHHQIELGYLVARGAGPRHPHAGVRRCRRPRSRRAGGDRRAHVAQRRPRPAARRAARPGERRRRDRLRGRRRRRVRRRPSTGCARSAPTSSRAAPSTAATRCDAAGSHHGAVGRRSSRSCSDSPTRRRRSRRRWSRAASSPRAWGSGTSCSPRRRSTSRTAFLTDGLGLAQSDWLETELAPGHRPRGALLPLQRAAPHGRAGARAVRAAAVPAPRDVRGERPRRRRRRVRPGVGHRPADPERARPSRQRRHVQLLPADAGRLPDRVRPRRARRSRDDWDDNRRYDRISAWGHQPLRQS